MTYTVKNEEERLIMTKQEFINLGLTEEQATKCAEASKTELATFIPKSRFDEVNEAKKTAEANVKERDKQIETLKKDNGDNAELQKQIETLQTQNKEAEKKYNEDLKNLQLTNAIKLALSGKAQDEDLVAGLFDKSKLIIGDDGKVTGLTEQLESLKKDKAFLFKEDKLAPTTQPKPGFTLGGNPPAPGNGGTGTVSLKDAIAARFQQQN